MTTACFSFCLYALCQFANFEIGREQLAFPSCPIFVCKCFPQCLDG